MQIELEAKTRDCAGNSCPARYKVIGAPGGKVFIGKKLDPETLAQLDGKIGPDEDAFWVPDDVGA